MSGTLHLGEIISINAGLFPGKQAARDLMRSLTFRGWNDRACRVANALSGIGLEKGDRVAILAYNCLEWLEIYAGLAKSGLVAVPVNFRLAGPEIRYIVENAGAEAIIVQDDLLTSVEAIRADLSLASDRYIHFGGDHTPAGYGAYEDLLAVASASEPCSQVQPSDPFALLYTSGTTGRPKGAIRSHESSGRSRLHQPGGLRVRPRRPWSPGHAHVSRELHLLHVRLRVLRRRLLRL